MILDETRSYDVHEIPIEESTKKSSANVMLAVPIHEDTLNEHNQDF
jgi:hypothetical protein